MTRPNEKEWPGPIRWGFRKVRFNAYIHWVRDGVSPCGSTNGDDLTTDQYAEDVTCPKCKKALGVG